MIYDMLQHITFVQNVCSENYIYCNVVYVIKKTQLILNLPFFPPKIGDT